jgi:hypothetical protein
MYHSAQYIEQTGLWSDNIFSHIGINHLMWNVGYIYHHLMARRCTGSALHFSFHQKASYYHYDQKTDHQAANHKGSNY